MPTTSIRENKQQQKREVRSPLSILRKMSDPLGFTHGPVEASVSR
jgi:hypothetical protein